MRMNVGLFICRARPYHRMKLMLVGKAGRGKTTLLKRISEKGQQVTFTQKCLKSLLLLLTKSRFVMRLLKPRQGACN